MFGGQCTHKQQNQNISCFYKQLNQKEPKRVQIVDKIIFSSRKSSSDPQKVKFGIDSLQASDQMSQKITTCISLSYFSIKDFLISKSELTLQLRSDERTQLQIQGNQKEQLVKLINKKLQYEEQHSKILQKLIELRQKLDKQMKQYFKTSGPSSLCELADQQNKIAYQWEDIIQQSQEKKNQYQWPILNDTRDKQKEQLSEKKLVQYKMIEEKSSEILFQPCQNEKIDNQMQIRQLDQIFEQQISNKQQECKSSSVSKETAKKIQDHLKQINYQPHNGIKAPKRMVHFNVNQILKTDFHKILQIQQNVSVELTSYIKNKLRKHKPKRRSINKYRFSRALSYKTMIAFILAHQPLFKDENQQFMTDFITKHLEEKLAYTLLTIYQSFRKRFAGITPNKIAQKLIKKYKFTQEEIQAQKQDILKNGFSNKELFFTKITLQSEFSQRLYSFPLHQFNQASVEFIPKKWSQQFSCTSCRYRFMPSLKKNNVKMKNWKHYQMCFEIQLKIPSVHIMPRCQEDDDQLFDRGVNMKREQGFWISINGDRKNYYKKTDIINRMRALDLENKLNQIKILQLTFNKNEDDEEDKSFILRRDDNKQKESKKEKQSKVSQNKNSQELAQTTKSQSQRWTIEQQLRFIEFFLIYEPVASKLLPGEGNRQYFKVSQSYIKSKDYKKTYFHFLASKRSTEKIEAFLQKQLENLKLNREEIDRQFSERVYEIIKIQNMVIIENRIRGKEHDLKLNISDMNEEEVRHFLKDTIDKYKIKILIKNQVQRGEQQSLQQTGQKGKKDLNEGDLGRERTKSLIDSIIPLEYQDIESKLIYEYMQEQNELHKNIFEQNQSERKLRFYVSFQVKKVIIAYLIKYILKMQVDMLQVWLQERVEKKKNIKQYLLKINLQIYLDLDLLIRNCFFIQIQIRNKYELFYLLQLLIHAKN